MCVCYNSEVVPETSTLVFHICETDETLKFMETGQIVCTGIYKVYSTTTSYCILTYFNKNEM